MRRNKTVNHDNKHSNSMRDGRVAVVARLDFHDWDGNLVGRTKAKTTEKNLGCYMIDNIQDKFSISESEIQHFRRASKENEIKEQNRISKHRKPIEWRRDSRGNII